MVCLSGTMLAACAAKQPAGATPAAQPTAFPVVELDAIVDPPASWRALAVVKDSRSVHQTWTSATGDTAYGVIRFSLPLPIGDDLALWGFLREMRQEEGDATLLHKHREPETGLLRFESEGGRYRIRGIIVTRGFGGWVVYAGTLRGGRIRLDELGQAVQAREKTILGIETSLQKAKTASSTRRGEAR